MYTTCIIEYLDDNSQLEAIIKDNHEFLESEDDQVFYYGLSKEDLERIKNKKEIVDGEWIVIEVLNTMEEL